MRVHGSCHVIINVHLLHALNPFWQHFRRQRATGENQRKENKLYAWLHPDIQSATRGMNVIRSGCRICRVLLASWWLSTGGGRGGGGGGGMDGGGGNNTAEIHDSLPRNLVDWLHLQENACGKRILNQHSLLPCQCRTEPERGQNASAAHPYKHFRQWGNYICMGARDELGNLPFHGND